MRSSILFAGCLAAMFASGCAHTWSDHSGRPTCVVLSAGGPAGVAHLGALQAVGDANIRVDCVTGTSMGALVGGLYAAAPQKPVRAEYEQLLSQYRAETAEVTGRNALVGSVLGALIAGIITGGASTLPLLLGASAGAAAAANATPAVELQRFEDVLHRYHHGVTIEALSLPYATFYQQRHETGLRLVVARQGVMAHAVARSMANPFVFEGFDPVASGYVDPGADRMTAVPVEDTCRLFPKARILAINTSGQDVVYSQKMKCPLLEVRVNSRASVAALDPRTPEFAEVVKLGFEITQQTLRNDGRR